MKRHFQASGRVKSKRQPSLPGFPDIPDELEIEIPNMGWEQIGGDMDPGTYGGTIARGDGSYLELLKIQPVREYVGDGEAKDVGFPFWTRVAQFDLDDLNLKHEDVKSALKYVSLDHDALEELTPTQRALAIGEALLDYGRADEGSAGWSDDILPLDAGEQVKWMSGTVAGSEYLSDEDDAFKDDVLGYSDIRTKLEEAVEASADASAAMAWSTVGDRMREDAERDGFDPDSLVGIAEFNDAVAVNGDLETEKTQAGVEGELEAEGYELTDLGGRVPTTEEHVDPEGAIRRVARDMNVDVDIVTEAAKGIDWWPKDRYDEIASSTSGYASIWGKKDKNREVDDPDYIIQALWSDGTIVGGLGGHPGTFGFNDEDVAIREAKKMLRDPTFEGDSVRVITRDGDLVWDSEGGGTEEPRRRPRKKR